MKTDKYHRLTQKFSWLDQLVEVHRGTMEKSAWVRQRLGFVAARRLPTLFANVARAIDSAVSSTAMASDSGVAVNYWVELYFFYHLDGEQAGSRRFEADVPINQCVERHGQSDRRYGAEVLLRQRRRFVQAHPGVRAHLDAIVMTDVKWMWQHGSACSFEIYLVP